jgi:glycine dehydrogenase subunit 2
MLIFEKSKAGRYAKGQMPNITENENFLDIPKKFLRAHAPRWPECSELQVVRHFTQLSQKNYSIDTQFYPLGSCTMKYNPRGVQKASFHPNFLKHHPLTPANLSQGLMEILYLLQVYLCDITGMSKISLTPMAGSQGEFAGVAMVKAYHASRHDHERTQFLIPDAAHGTNPASAAMCGYEIIEIPTGKDGDLDLDALKQNLGPKTAGIMLTNPSTLGLFSKQILEIAKCVHDAGGLLYYDGANLNAIAGQVRPGDMGFDVMHLNLHKTFATPHGGGGPGAGPVAVNAKLEPFLPIGYVEKNQNLFSWAEISDHPQSIGRLSCFMGNINMLLRAYFYIKMLGKQGIQNIAKFSSLNANYLFHALQKIGYQAAYPTRRASHEFVITLKNEKAQYQINAMDVAKRLLDFGFHAPTTYFPLLIPECLLIEPTETECKEELDAFIDAMAQIRKEMTESPEMLRLAPHTKPVTRLDDVKAARDLDLNFYGSLHEHP